MFSFCGRKNYVVVEVINLVAQQHDKWLRISRSFGLNDDAEDLVQDMYLKINDWKGKYDKSLMYNNNEVNHFFVFKVLRGLFLDKVKRKKYECRLEHHERASSFNPFEYNEQLEILQNEIKSWHLYDRKIYELIFEEGYNMSELSNMTGIDYYSIRRTKNKIQKLLNDKIKDE